MSLTVQYGRYTVHPPLPLAAGHKARIECDRGYDTENHMSVYELDPKGKPFWNPSLIRCGLGSLPIAVFGKWNPDAPGKPPYHSGHSATLRCDPGYEIRNKAQGTSKVVVKIDPKGKPGLEWFPASVHCEPMTHSILPYATHGIFDSTFQRPYKMGDRATLRCNPGYVSGVILSILVPNAAGNGLEWDPPGIDCHLRSCGKPRDIHNGLVTGNVYTFGSDVVYGCLRGYRFRRTDGLTLARFTCSTFGNWQPPIPPESDMYCRPVECPALPVPDHGAVSYEDGERVYGREATYVCDSDRVLVGKATRRCESDGNWSGVAPTCRLQSCPILPWAIVSASGSLTTFDCGNGRQETVGCIQRRGRWHKVPCKGAALPKRKVPPPSSSEPTTAFPSFTIFFLIFVCLILAMFFGLLRR